MPVANLKTYGTVSLSVRASAFASQGLAMYLEEAVVGRLRQHCSFTRIERPNQNPADVILDLNITSTGKGGGIVSTSAVATIDTLLVLTDGQSGDLLGTARIRGKSSGSILNSRAPENQAVDVVATEIANLLAKSGCAGPRLARTEPPPSQKPATGSAVSQGSAGTTSEPTTPDESKRAAAEQLNEDGKVKLRSADMKGALALFQQANATLPDARYQYNVCLAFEALEQWDNAVAACQQARGMNPEARLVQKIDKRLEALQQRGR